MNNILKEEPIATNQINTKRIQGIRGWLIVFVIFLALYSWGWLAPSIKGFDMWIYRFELWKIQYSLLSSIFHLFNVISPLLLIYLIIKKKNYAILFSKVFFFIMPLVNTANEYFFSLFPFNLFDKSFEIIGSLSFSIIWLLYLTNSIRVANTFLFSENKLPKFIDCPFCNDRIEIEEEERINKVALCPSCATTISKNTVAT